MNLIATIFFFFFLTKKCALEKENSFRRNENDGFPITGEHVEEAVLKYKFQQVTSTLDKLPCVLAQVASSSTVRKIENRFRSLQNLNTKRP